MFTPTDLHAAPQRRRQHMRDTCCIFATSTAGHETYPGHHLRYVHHKLGTARDSIGRYFMTPQFVEGWVGWTSACTPGRSPKSSDGKAPYSCWARDCVSCACVMG